MPSLDPPDPGPGPVPEVRPGDGQAWDALSLAALVDIVGRDPVLFRRVVDSFGCWDDLAAAGPAARAAIDPALIALRVPRHVPSVHCTGAGVERVTYRDHAYPAGLRADPEAPPVLYVRGAVPETALVAVCGPTHLSSGARDVAASAGVACATAGLGVVAAVDDPAGRAAVVAAVRAGACGVLVAASDPAVGFVHQRDFDEVVAAGGAVISEWEPTVTFRPGNVAAAQALAVRACSVVVLVEVGTSEGSGLVAARTAVAAGTVVAVVVDPRPSPARHLGSDAFTSPRHWLPSSLGDGPRVAARMAVGSPAADAVVSAPGHLAVDDFARTLTRLVTDPPAPEETVGC